MTTFNPIHKRYTIMLCLVLPCVLGQAQITISGKVKDKEGTPLPAVSLQIKTTNQNILSFAISKADGSYSFSIKSADDTLYLLANKLRYTNFDLKISGSSQTVDIVLSEGVIVLKNIEVKPPPIRKRGDTLSFKVEEFHSTADRSIGDVLRKIPGIEIDSQGRISYQGKNINRYYVENLNLMGQNYSLINENLPRGKVAILEIFENHQPIRALDSLKSSEQAAINLKLKNKYTTATKLDYGLGVHPFLWEVNMTPFVFIPNFQFVGSLQSNNIGRNSLSQDFNFTENGKETDPNWLHVKPLDPPPFNTARWLKNISNFGSVNSLKKNKKHLEIRLNSFLSLEEQKQNAETIDQYFLENTSILYQENSNYRLKRNTFNSSLNLENNTPKKYLKNILNFEKTWNSDNGFTARENRTYDQEKVGENMKIRNNFHRIIRHKKNAYNFYSIINHSTDLQELHISLVGKDTLASPLQKLSTKNTYTHHYMDFIHYLGNSFSMSTHIGIKTQNSRIKSVLNHYPVLQDSLNNFKLNTIDYYLSPTFSLNKSKVWLSLNAPSSYLSINVKDPAINQHYGKWLVNPSFSFKLKLSQHFEYSNFTGLQNSFSGASEMFTGYIMSNYLNISKKNTYLNHIKTFNFSNRLKYSDAINGITFYMNYSIIKNKFNQIGGLNISNDGFTETLFLLKENISNTQMANGNFSKYFFSFKTTLSLNFALTKTSTQRLLNQSYSNLKLNTYATSLKASYQASKHININYEASFRTNINANLKIQNFNQDLSFIVIPTSKITTLINLNHSGIKTITTQHFVFTDATLRYQIKKWKQDLEINVTNIFNQREFSSIYQNDYYLQISTLQLRPRQFVIRSRINF